MYVENVCMMMLKCEHMNMHVVAFVRKCEYVCCSFCEKMFWVFHLEALCGNIDACMYGDNT